MYIHLNIGSNQGDRRLNLSRAISRIHRAFGPFIVSHSIESDAWGYDSPHRYLNIGITVRSDDDPIDILHTLQDIEKEISPAPHRNPDGTYADRLIDIDIMAIDITPDDDPDRIPPRYNIETIDRYPQLKTASPELTLPHPHLNERPFFLTPLTELRNILLDTPL